MTQDDKKASDPISPKDFFEKVPPGRPVLVQKALREEREEAPAPHVPAGVASRPTLRAMDKVHYLELPTLDLHCPNQSCDGVRSFSPLANVKLDNSSNDPQPRFVAYRCRNCGEFLKMFACWFRLVKDSTDMDWYKFGEDPPFGPPTPAKVITLLGSEKENYLKGRRAESQGMGIAAYAYYRRSVENKKNAILDEIIRVSERLGAPANMVADMKAARQETQFKTAIEAIKHGIPESLMVNGQNPLTLLHSALSAGLHDHSDEECLELAADIRVVLTEMVERMTAAMKDEAELKASVGRLMNRGAAKNEKT